MTRRTPILLLTLLCLASGDCLARGGFSSGGRGGFSRSFSSPSRSFSAPPATRTVTTRTTVTRSIGGGYYGYHPLMYPGFGMGYGYSNGMITGLILGNLMHPQGTTVYTGGGYGGSALLYPDGRVVDQNGYQVGTYANGQFTPQPGGMVAQPAPADAQPPGDDPVSAGVIACGVIVGVLVVLILIALVV